MDDLGIVVRFPLRAKDGQPGHAVTADTEQTHSVVRDVRNDSVGPSVVTSPVGILLELSVAW
jgi:hypothetical protein